MLPVRTGDTEEERRKKQARDVRWGLFEMFDRGVTSGVYGLGETGGDLLTWAGFPEYGDPLSKYMQARGKDYAPPESIRGHVSESPELLKNPEWWAYNVGRTLPSQIPSWGAGGLAFAGARTLGAGAAGAATAAGAGSGVVGGLMEGSSTYRKAKELGMDEGDASMAATGMAVGSGLLNALPVGGAFGAKTLAGRALAGGLGEGLTEGAEEPLEAGLLGTPMKEAIANAVDVFFPSALTGAGGAAMASAVSATEKRSAPTARKMVDILEQNDAPGAETFKQAAKRNYEIISEEAQGKNVTPQQIDYAMAESLRPAFRQAMREASPYSTYASERDLPAQDVVHENLYKALDVALTTNPRAALQTEMAAPDRHVLWAAGVPRTKSALGETAAPVLTDAVQAVTDAYNKKAGVNLTPAEAMAAISYQQRAADQTQVGRSVAQDMPATMKMADILKAERPDQAETFVKLASDRYGALVQSLKGKPVDPAVIDQHVAQVMRPVFQQMAQQPVAEPAAMFAKVTPAPTFYSAVEKAVGGIQQERGTPEQMLAQIKKTPGVKQSELDWIGLDTWLAEQKGPVTRQQIADYVKQNAVDVKEVTLGGDKQSALDDAQNHVAQRDSAGETDTKYHSYQTPGGKNYRELLLTLPDNSGPWIAKKTEASAAGRVAMKLFQEHGQNDPRTIEAMNVEKKLWDEANAMRSGAIGFQSSHFDEPNILAHVRFNERTDADGKRVLFIEEVQSDWAQKGRKKGFQSGEQDITVREDANVWVVKFPDGRAVDVSKKDASSKEEAIPFAIKRRNEQPNTAWHYTPSGVPSAPFVANTGAWSMLAMKRMIRYAAEKGFDKIAWTTGEQQAARYDLSKQIDGIQWAHYGDNKVDVYAQKLGQRNFENMGRFTYDKLDEVVGKELADKIITERKSGKVNGEYSGVDLKIGGEGMKSFYDKMLPNEVNKYVKKWGGKVVGNSFEITPAMRDSVLQGQPLFAKASAGDGVMASKRAVDQTETWKPALAEAQVSSEVDRITKSWKRAPQIVVAPSIDYAPDYVKAEAARRGGDAKGFYDTKTGAVWLISKKLKDAADVQRTVLHESWGHHGIRLLNENMAPILRDVSAKYDLRDIADAYNLDIDNNNEHRLIAAEEKIAQLIETHKDAGLVDRIIAYVRKGLRDMGVTLKMSDNDVKYLLTRIKRAVATGKDARSPEAMGQRVAGNGARFQQAPATLSDEQTYARPSSINVTKTNSSEEVEALTRATAKQFAGQVNEAKRGQMTMAQLDALARDLGQSPEFVREFLTRKAGTAYSAEYLRAAQALHRDSAEFTSKMLDAYQKSMDDGTLTDKDRAEMWEQVQRHVMVVSQYSGVAAEAGRALRSLRDHAMEMQGTIPWKQSEIDDLILRVGGRENVDLLVSGIAAAKESGQMNKAAVAATETRFIDKVLEAWISGLLSGPQTHVVNATSNAIVSVLGDVEAFVAAGLGGLHGGEKYTLKQALGRVNGTIPGVMEGMTAAAKAMRSEEAVDLFGKLDGYRKQAIEGDVGKAVRLPLRFLNASDMLFKAVAISKYIHSEAARTGVSVDTLKADPKVMEKAWNAARYETFTKELGGLGKRVTAMANAHPWMRFVIPFIRTPTNILKYAAERSPLAFSMTSFHRAYNEGGAARDLAVAKVVVGSAVMLTAYVLAKAGDITGSGPDDPAEKAVLRATGWAPYSIRLNGKYYSYQRLEPFGMLLGLAADMSNLADKTGEQDMSTLVQLGTMSFFHNITSKTYLRGLSDVMNAITDPERYGEKWIASLAGTVVPTGVAQIARTNDPYLRKANGIIDQIKSRIPGLRETLPKQRDVFGQPIKLQGGVGPDILSPVYESSETGDKVAAELLRLGVHPGAPGKTIANHELTPKERERYSEVFGKLLRQFVKVRMSRADWRQLPDERKIELIDDAINDARKYSRQMMIAQNPTIMLRPARQ